eukprot:712407-Hanusia_phi.AAC.5
MQRKSLPLIFPHWCRRWKFSLRATRDPTKYSQWQRREKQIISSQGLMGMIQQQLSSMPSQSKKPRQAEKNMGTDPLQTLFNRLQRRSETTFTRVPGPEANGSR